MSTAPNPVRAPAHVHELLENLHKVSSEQEASLDPTSPRFVLDSGTKSADKPAYGTLAFADRMRDKLIALDKDKCHFVYSMILATGARNVVEAGTSHGVSTIYLSLAVGENMRNGEPGKVIATENETEKAAIAREHWKKCGEDVASRIELREGDILETLKVDLPEVDLLLLDIWAPLALPVLEVVRPRLRHGAVILTDNPIAGAHGYKHLLAYLNDEKNGFRNVILPYTSGFEMSVYMP